MAQIKPSIAREFIVLTKDELYTGEVIEFNPHTNSITDILRNPYLTLNEDAKDDTENLWMKNTLQTIRPTQIQRSKKIPLRDILLAIDQTPQDSFVGDQRRRNATRDKVRLEYEISFKLDNAYIVKAHFMINEDRLDKTRTIDSILSDEGFIAVHDITNVLPSQEIDQEKRRLIGYFMKNARFIQQGFSPRATINLNHVTDYELLKPEPSKYRFNKTAQIWERI